jgi:bleomycin hydrolase
MMESIDNALMSGYSVAWACDMRGKGFSMRKGVAVVPQENWNDLDDKEYEEILDSPHPQKKITQALRQNEFGNRPITGDHGMHIVGIAHDQNGHIFYKVKNSWGTTGKYNGYIYVSREYVMLKTTDCMVNKNSLPLSVAQKLGIETSLHQENPVAASDKKEIKPRNIQTPLPAAVPLNQ